MGEIWFNLSKTPPQGFLQNAAISWYIWIVIHEKHIVFNFTDVLVMFFVFQQASNESVSVMQCMTPIKHN